MHVGPTYSSPSFFTYAFLWRLVPHFQSCVSICAYSSFPFCLWFIGLGGAVQVFRQYHITLTHKSCIVIWIGFVRLPLVLVTAASGQVLLVFTWCYVELCSAWIVHCLLWRFFGIFLTQCAAKFPVFSIKWIKWATIVTSSPVMVHFDVNPWSFHLRIAFLVTCVLMNAKNW